MNILDKIEKSFKASLKGEENLQIVIYRWGLIAWFAAYFIANKLVKIIDLRFMDISISIVTSIYFIWHIYVVRKCAPKKKKLTKEEKRQLRKENRKDFNKKLMKKLLLQESITKWNPVTVAIVTDVFCIAHFLGYII